MIFQGGFLLIYRDKKGFFDALQEDASQVAYGTLLGRLVCFYIRILSLQDESELNEDESDDTVAWFKKNPLTETQRNKIRQLKNLLDSTQYNPREHDVFLEISIADWLEQTTTEKNPDVVMYETPT